MRVGKRAGFMLLLLFTLSRCASPLVLQEDIKIFQLFTPLDTAQIQEYKELTGKETLHVLPTSISWVFPGSFCGYTSAQLAKAIVLLNSSTYIFLISTQQKGFSMKQHPLKPSKEIHCEKNPTFVDAKVKRKIIINPYHLMVTTVYKVTRLRMSKTILCLCI